MIHNFQEVKLALEVKTFCTVCLKKRVRTIKDFQTLNPYNKNKDGNIKTINEIQTEVANNLIQKEKDLIKSGIICRKCEDPKV